MWQFPRVWDLNHSYSRHREFNKLLASHATCLQFFSASVSTCRCDSYQRRRTKRADDKENQGNRVFLSYVSSSSSSSHSSSSSSSSSLYSCILSFLISFIFFFLYVLSFLVFFLSLVCFFYFFGIPMAFLWEFHDVSMILWDS